jgi:pyruvate/2-oxoglutarate/acetoin dehydrogenase E1 component/TPP-dependent pyruvate/acetoin dehydrogenase alpha subunit
MTENPALEEIVSTKTVEQLYKEEVLNDFWICLVSRETSLLARKEVLTGKAKFGIVGDGKELPQVVMAKFFKKGDWRSGYYRDQTFMMALGLSTVEDFFAQLYADHDNDPFSGGRQMNSHYASVTVDEEGEWTNHNELYNISSDISCTAGQMARALGLAVASKKYRENPKLNSGTNFSENGNEVCFVTIGDASTSEGVFWETVNAACVEKVPMAISVWDDGYGISVPKEFQTTKGSISKALEGMEYDGIGNGIEIYRAKAWDYQGLCQTYETAIDKCRDSHIPCLVHVDECTQQTGHSTSGSHERYKSKERLQWEKDMDCIKVMGEWIVNSGIATQEEVDDYKKRAKDHVKEAKNRAWKAYNDPIVEEKKVLANLFEQAKNTGIAQEEVAELANEFKRLINPVYGELVQIARKLKFLILGSNSALEKELNTFLDKSKNLAHKRYHTHLYSSSKFAALNVPYIAPKYSEDSPLKNGYEIINKFFDKSLENNENIYAFGEDVGFIGDVNQGFAGLQDKYGASRVFDTGIREWTIMGQAIGMAIRGLRPIAEIQYLDYLIYGLEPLSDDLSTIRWRSNGIQQAPAIIRTRGHRLEGIWHAGSPMGMMINALRGMYLCVPRNMVQAAGMYQTLLMSDDPAVVVECLNGYRLKERLPDNIGEYTVPLGMPEVLEEGTDVTLVTYGSCIRVAQQGIELLKKKGISVELIDVQTLLPFDLEHRIVDSLKKTNRVVFMDEDVPGGATAYIMQEVLEKQGGYKFLDSNPITLTAKAHRPPYGSDGDYFSKPNPEDVFEVIYKMVYESDPERLGYEL